MKSVLIKTVLIAVILIGFKTEGYAGFPIGNGRWLLVPTYTRYYSEGYWNQQGQFNNFDNAGRYESNYLGLYGGHGIGRDLDLVFNIPYVTQRYIENGQTVEQLSTVGDISVGLSYFLNHYDYFKHLAITGSLIFPAYPSNLSTPLLPGFNSTGAEVKIGLAGTNTKKLKDTYYDMEAGLRTYFNSGGPTQLFANATLGVPIEEDWKISGTLNFISSSSNSGYVKPSSTATYSSYLNRDFSYLRGTLSVGRRIDRNIWLWGSIFRDFTGRSIGQGQGYSIFAVVKF